MTETTDQFGTETQYIYDAAGRTIASTDTYLEGTDVEDISGTLYFYDDAGRTTCTKRVAGLDIMVGAMPTSDVGMYSVVQSFGTVLSLSEAHHGAQRRVDLTADQFGTETEYTYDADGRTIEVRSQSHCENDNLVWLVSLRVTPTKGTECIRHPTVVYWF